MDTPAWSHLSTCSSTNKQDGAQCWSLMSAPLQLNPICHSYCIRHHCLAVLHQSHSNHCKSWISDLSVVYLSGVSRMVRKRVNWETTKHFMLLSLDRNLSRFPMSACTCKHTDFHTAQNKPIFHPCQIKTVELPACFKFLAPPQLKLWKRTNLLYYIQNIRPLIA